MVRQSFAQRFMAAFLALMMFAVTVPLGTVQASMISTESMMGSQQAEADRETVRDFLTRDDVRDQMEKLGVDSQEAIDRLEGLTPDELSMAAARIENSPAGQGPGAVVGAVVFIFLVLLLTDILGLTNVFRFVN